jgi:hypothetical protein
MAQAQASRLFRMRQSDKQHAGAQSGARLWPCLKDMAIPISSTWLQVWSHAWSSHEADKQHGGGTV